MDILYDHMKLKFFKQYVVSWETILHCFLIGASDLNDGISLQNFEQLQRRACLCTHRNLACSLT